MGFMRAFGKTTSPDKFTNYYFNIDKTAALKEWTDNFGAITAGPIDVNDRLKRH